MTVEHVAHDGAPGTGEYRPPVGLPGAALLPRLDARTVAANTTAIALLQEQAVDVIDLREERAHV